MQIAQIKDGMITAVQNIQKRPTYDGGRWWDLRDQTVLDEWLSEFNWVTVTETPKPTDTATTIYDESVIKLVDGLPVEEWLSRPWTPEELANKARQTNGVTIQGKADAALANNKTFLASTPTTAQAVTQVKALTRQVNALIRYTMDRLDSTEGV